MTIVYNLDESMVEAIYAKRFFNDWYRRGIRTTMKPMKKLAKALKERIDNIVTYCTHGIINGVAKGINRKTISNKRLSVGYLNFENLKKAIFFHLCGLDVYSR